MAKTTGEYNIPALVRVLFCLMWYDYNTIIIFKVNRYRLFNRFRAFVGVFFTRFLYVKKIFLKNYSKTIDKSEKYDIIIIDTEYH